MRRATVRKATIESGRRAAREWLKDPQNRELARASYRRTMDRLGEASAERRSVRTAFAREILAHVVPPRERECAICGDAFEIPYGPGKPASYCEACVTRYNKAAPRRCKGCGRSMSRGRRLTCKNCGRLWGEDGGTQ